jgi:AraC family transcriptional regulator of adaptative response / DNA-3-methyladenine glycosylase II
VQLDPAACYRALRTRDARFDGRFVTAVRSTGIYCRPICPAPTPKRENCVFLSCAAAAQAAGYRPCLRCRPESAPGTPAWCGSSATVRRALRLIDEGTLDRAPVAALAARLGVGERQLRRLFLRHLGTSPLAVAQTRRVLFAKRLLDETELPITRVAFAAGFASVRRFNAALRETWGRAPNALRRRRSEPALPASRGEIALRLPFRPPYDWEGVLAYLAARATPGVEEVAAGCWRRTLRCAGAEGVVSVERVGREPELRARFQLSRPAPLAALAARLRAVFDLGADPFEIRAHLRRDPRLRGRVDARPGLRLPGAWDAFELAVRVVLGQQVSVRAATASMGRLVERFGQPLRGAAPAGTGLRAHFPPAEALAQADLARIGLPRQRADCLRALASAVAAGRLELEAPRGLEETLAALRCLPGVGDWTAQLIALRLGEPDAFPAGDLGLRRAFGAGAGSAGERALRAAAEAWRPWRGYAAMALWLGAPTPRSRARGSARRLRSPARAAPASAAP